MIRSTTKELAIVDVPRFSPKCAAYVILGLFGLYPIFSGGRFLPRDGVQIRKGGIDIPTNPKAAWSEDISSIQHFPNEQEVVVTFAAYARCPKPYLRARLSGPALAILQNWTFEGELGPNRQPAAPTSTYTTGISTMTASYEVPIEGNYFVEILGLYCEDFSYGLQQQLNNHSLGDWMRSSEGELFLNYDLRGACVEDMRINRLTAEKATISISNEEINRDKLPDESAGYWINKKKLRKQKPVYTRWQPSQCFVARHNNKPTPKACIDTISLDRLDDYEFEWRQHDSFLEKLKQHPQPVHFCMVGASHSGYLTSAGKHLFSSNSKIAITLLESPYPTQVTYELLTSQNCTHYIVATGQHPASFMKGHPYGWAEWEQEMRQLIGRLQIVTSNFLLRSIHYNPLGHPIQICPATDWRNPMMIDGYNAILEQLAVELGVPYADTRWIDGAIWDGAPDWCHLNQQSNNLEIIYLMAISLGYL